MTHQHTYDSELFNPQCHECGKIMRVDGTDLSVAEDLLWLKWKDEGSLCVTFVADCLLAGEDNKGRTKDMSFLTKKLRCFIKQEIRQALESQMSDLRKEVEKLKKPDITMFKKLKCFFNIHGKDDWEMTRGMMMWCYKCHKPRV